MPLHLLGKKSWNVYSKENVERVRRDEAAAVAREEEEERKMQALDAERRIAILRGQRQPTPPTHDEPGPPGAQVRHERLPADSGGRKRRRLAGENDTDRDIRLAQETAHSARAASNALLQVSRTKDGAPLYDNDGHINLFPVDTRGRRESKGNAEVKLEKERRERQYEDQYTMRFSNAAGKDGHKEPWYAGRRSRARGGSAEADADEALRMDDKDAWGRPDPRRREREQSRTSTNDPLAFMKKAQTQLKQSEVDRRRWEGDRRQEMRYMEQDHRASRRKRKHVDPSEDLDSFDLDAAIVGRVDEDTSRSHRRHHDHSTTYSAKGGEHRPHR